MFLSQALSGTKADLPCLRSSKSAKSKQPTPVIAQRAAWFSPLKRTPVGDLHVQPIGSNVLSWLLGDLASGVRSSQIKPPRCQSSLKGNHLTLSNQRWQFRAPRHWELHVIEATTHHRLEAFDGDWIRGEICSKGSLWPPNFRIS